jgi:hypothetical protein
VVIAFLLDVQLAKGQQQRRAAQNTINGANNEALATSLNCFTENRNLAMGPDGKVKRIDMFRGFTEEQRRTIYQQNQDIIRQNAYVAILYGSLIARATMQLLCFRCFLLLIVYITLWICVTHSMAKQAGARLDEEWVMQQNMAMRAMEQVRLVGCLPSHLIALCLQ